MKPALYVAIVGTFYSHNVEGLRIVTVTTEKGRQWYGRDAEGNTTHGTLGSIRYRFPNEASAEDALMLARRIASAHQPRIDEAEARYMRLRREAREAMDEAVANCAKLAVAGV